MDLKAMLDENGVNDIDDEEWKERVITDLVRSYCNAKNYELSEDDMSVIKELGMETVFEVWKDFSTVETTKTYPSDTQILL